MKYLLVLAVVAVAIWIWRNNRREAIRAATPPQRSPRVAEPEAMERCAYCGLHLPAADAVSGRNSTRYCTPAHRQAAEG